MICWKGGHLPFPETHSPSQKSSPPPKSQVFHHRGGVDSCAAYAARTIDVTLAHICCVDSSSSARQCCAGMKMELGRVGNPSCALVVRADATADNPRLYQRQTRALPRRKKPALDTIRDRPKLKMGTGN